jgi:uncharacterized protein (UPF0261 family)
MRTLPIGLPKMMVSTLASGDVGPYIDVSDIVMMPSITDMAGLNSVSRMVLRNAAFAVVGMAAAPVAHQDSKASIGLTMFGVTTPCVTRVVETLRDRYDCLVFHATGTGGRAMEKLADSDKLAGIIDVTTTEVCDYLFGGVLSAGPDRLGVIARQRPLCGLSRSTRHGEFLGARECARAVSPPQSLCPQSAGDVDAHHAGRMPSDRRLDRWKAQCV